MTKPWPAITFSFKYYFGPKTINELLIRGTGNKAPRSSIQLNFITSSIKWKSQTCIWSFKTLIIHNGTEEAIKHNYFWNIFKVLLPKVYNGIFSLFYFTVLPIFCLLEKKCEVQRWPQGRGRQSVSISLNV